MLRLTLTDAERTVVAALRRGPVVAPAEQDRAEIVLRSATGWSPPRTAAHLEYHAVTVRTVLKRSP